MTYNFLENKERADLEKMKTREIIDAYLSLQNMYNDLEEDFSLKILDVLFWSKLKIYSCETATIWI